MQRKLPLRVTLWIVLVVILTAWQAVRLATGIAWSVRLNQFATFPGPIYISVIGAIWTATGVFLLWSRWKRQPWTRLAVLIAAALYAVWDWIDRLFIQSQIRANWPFALLTTIVLLVFTAWVILDPRNKSHFEREAYERESQEQTSA